jgi:monovalent cation:H+ antiporter-2, CPA2 family
MHDLSTIFVILAFLASTIVIVPIFHYLRVNPIIGYMLTGILLGRHGLGVVENAQDVAFLAELGVVFLLFAIGLDLTMERMKQMGAPALRLGVTQIIFCSIIFALLSKFLGQSMQASVIIGGSLALSSTALCLRLLTDSKEHSSSYGQIAISILLAQDLAVVPMMTLTPLLHSPGMDIVTAMALAMLKALVAIIAMVFFGRYVLKQIYRVVSHTRNAELFTATTLFVLFGCSYVTAQVGLSMALGAFLAGLLLAETEYHHQVESDMHPFRGILLGLFFTTVGINIDIGFIANNFYSVFALSLGIITIKGLLIFALGRFFGFPMSQSIRVGVLLSQGGEFAFIVLGLALKEHLLAHTEGQLLFGAIGLTMVTTPFLLNQATLIVHRLFPHKASFHLFPELSALKDHVVIIGFGRIGQNIATILETQNFSYVGVDINEHLVALSRKNAKPVFYGDATHVRLLESLGAENAKVVIISIDDPFMSLRICHHMLKHFPGTKLVVRAHDDHHVEQLSNLGINTIALETTEISIQISALALEKYGLTAEDIATIIDQFRQDHFASYSA